MDETTAKPLLPVTWMPCLGPTGLQLFGTTADQRAKLGKTRFLATHFPIAMRTQAAGQLNGQVTEELLLERILSTQDVSPGNRVFVLYGAAGAGKSELLRWLALQIERLDPTRAAALVRVSRTELDVVRIVERFQAQLSGTYFSAQTQARWADLRSKPLTLAKMLVLSALERLLTRDEEINALFYWLTGPVQHNLERGLDAGQSESGVLELLRVEDWEDVAQKTDLANLIDPEALRQALADAFRSLLMENVHLPDTLRRLSSEVMARYGVRPLLLIDDLVRSLNLFAGDLMDYLMTLEAGNWDVVVGLTPASLQTHTRGRQLLERIAYLDTIDDRVQKLWLSDDYGHDSYFLDEQNCHEFAARYLDGYRQLNGLSCRSCPSRTRCGGLGTSPDGRLLAPFNRALLRRLFRALPPGKGKARYFLKALDAILRSLMNGEAVWQATGDLVQRDYLAGAATPVEAALVEFYGERRDHDESAVLDKGVGRFFDVALDDTYAVVPLLTTEKTAAQSAGAPAQLGEDPERGAIRRWLEGETANRQLLRPLRQGIARWLRLIGSPNVLTRDGVAKPKGVLRWEHPYLDVSPPILLEGVDEQQEGIVVGRDLGLLAFDLAALARAKGESTRQLATRIAQDAHAAELVQAARMLRARLTLRLTDQLGMPLSRAALHLYLFVLCLHEGQPHVPGLPKSICQWLSQEQQKRGAWRNEIQAPTKLHLVNLFDDFYKLRENVYDGPAIAQWCAQCDDGDPLAPLMMPAPDRLDRDFVLGDQPLAAVLSAVQSMLGRWRMGEMHETLSNAAQLLLRQLSSNGRAGVVFNDVAPEVWEELRTIQPDVLTRLRVWKEPDIEKT